MTSERIINIVSGREQLGRRAGTGDLLPDTSPDSLTQRILSFGHVCDLSSELIGECFDGRLVLQFEAGYILFAKVEQPVKE